MGVFVNRGIEAKCREDCRKRIITRTHEVIAEAKAAGITLKEASEVVEKSYASDASPYSETPESILALAKARKRR
jgi:DNA-binding transcriptional regulator YhcF (GntR family)